MSPFQPVNPMRRPATATQRKMFDFIAARRGCPPTFREIMKHMGYHSTNAVTDVVTVLERRGWITRAPMTGDGGGQARSIRVRGAEVNP